MQCGEVVSRCLILQNVSIRGSVISFPRESVLTAEFFTGLRNPGITIAASLSAS
jgi:hypothetical protein